MTVSGTDLRETSRDDLRKLARELGVERAWNMNKPELLKVLAPLVEKVPAESDSPPKEAPPLPSNLVPVLFHVTDCPSVYELEDPRFYQHYGRNFLGLKIGTTLRVNLTPKEKATCEKINQLFRKMQDFLRRKRLDPAARLKE